MDRLQSQVQGYLESAGFTILPESREGLIVADERRIAAGRDTRLVWVAPPATEVRDFAQLESKLLREFNEIIPRHPHAQCFLLAYTREGYSQHFTRDELRSFNIRMRVPIEFFDNELRNETNPGIKSTCSGAKT